MEVAMTDALKSKEKWEEEIEGIQLLLENKANELEEANNKLVNEREVFRKRISTLK